jgi:hypothetical protein
MKDNKEPTKLNQRQRVILEILLKHKLQAVEMEAVWQEWQKHCPYTPTVFLSDWQSLLRGHCVAGIGDLKFIGDKVTGGKGVITPTGEDALKETSLQK